MPELETEIPPPDPSKTATGRANLHAFKTDGNGGATITLKLFDVDKEDQKRVLDLVGANIEYGFVRLPE